MHESIYLNDEYYRKNPTWDVEDSEWKAAHVCAVIGRLPIKPVRIAESGCGAGEVLNQLHRALSADVEFFGYDISPRAIEMCRSREKDRLNFNLGGVPEDSHFDVLLALDVFEHVDDYLGFLREIRNRADIKIFHMPLDMSVISVIKVTPILHARDSVGHLHYFSKETALRSLTDCGYEILDCFYTSGPINRVPRLLKQKKYWRLLDPVKRFFFMRYPDLWVRTLGGSMIVVAK